MTNRSSPARRLAAFMLDAAIPLVVVLMMIGGAAIVKSVGVFVVLLAGYLVWAFILFANGMTPGKKMMGVQVVKGDGRPADFFTMLIRETFGKFISGFVFGLGWIWILVDKENQGWHDKLVSTYVVKRGDMIQATD